MELKVENFVLTLYFTRFVLSLQTMKNLCNILVLMLASMVFNLGAGVGVVHICSAYCKIQACSSAVHSHTDMEECCHHDCEVSPYTSVSEECSCINVHYNIDFFKTSQDDDSVSFVPMPFDLPEHITYNFLPVFSGFISSQSSNAPPVIYGGRALLAFHSVLVI